jgi:hypothetical protein
VLRITRGSFESLTNAEIITICCRDKNLAWKSIKLWYGRMESREARLGTPILGTISDPNYDGQGCSLYYLLHMDAIHYELDLRI